LFQYRQLNTNTRTAKAQLAIDVTMSVEVARAVPVYGSHKGPESVTAAIRASSNQNLLFFGGFSVAGKPAASRAFRRRRFKTMSGMKHAIAKMGASHSQVSETPSGFENTPSNKNKEPIADSAISIFDGFMRSNEREISHRRVPQQLC
jgi:hypothetical protein